MIRIALFLLILLLPAWSAKAADAPVPANPRTQIKSLESNIQETEKQKADSEEKARRAETELSATKQELIKTGQTIQKNEMVLDNLEGRIIALEAEKSGLQKDLQRNRRSTGAMVLGLERIRRVPPAALIARPGAPLQTAQSLMLLGDIIPALDLQAREVKASLQRLDEITTKLEAQKREAATVMAAMTNEQKNLQKLADRRQQLFTSAHADLAAQEESIKRYASQSKTLKELMSKIEAQSRAQLASKAAAVKKESVAFAGSKTLLPQSGSMRLPVSGPVLTRYDEPDSFGAPSKGLTIESRPGAIIVAPMGGVVRFAGPFKNYGNMLIVEHKKGFHSLIAGLEKIDTVVGQSVSAGEPLGYARKNLAAGQPTVYYELRQDGEPVNPAKIFADLG